MLVVVSLVFIKRIEDLEGFESIVSLMTLLRLHLVKQILTSYANTLLFLVEKNVRIFSIAMRKILSFFQQK